MCKTLCTHCTSIFELLRLETIVYINCTCTCNIEQEHNYYACHRVNTNHHYLLIILHFLYHYTAEWIQTPYHHWCADSARGKPCLLPLVWRPSGHRHCGCDMHRDRDVLLATASSSHACQPLPPAAGLYHQETTEEWTAANKEVSCSWGTSYSFCFLSLHILLQNVEIYWQLNSKCELLKH